jgi:hypothetical protein
MNPNIPNSTPDNPFAGIATAKERRATIDSLPKPASADMRAVDHGLEELRQDAEMQGIPIEMLMSRGVTICSVHSRALYSEPLFHGGRRRIYKIDAADPDKGYATRTLFDTYQLLLDTSQSEEEITSQGSLGYTPRPVRAGQLAEYLVQKWTGDHWANSGGGNLGVGVLASRTPTQAELLRLRELRTLFCRTTIDNADGRWRDGKRDGSFAEARNAMEWMGSEDPVNHPWFFQLEMRTFIPGGCAACGGKVPATAFTCPDCHTNLAEYYLRRARAIDKLAMPAIYEEIEFLKLERAAATSSAQQMPAAPATKSSATKPGSGAPTSAP